MKKSLIKLTALSALLFAGGAAAESDKLFALDENQCNPPAGAELRGNAENGKALHVKNCADCHGLDGKANVVVMHMDETPKDQSDPAYMKNLPDPFLYIAICKGGEGIGKSYVMSPWGDYFTDQEIKDLIAWIRSFSST